MHSNLYTKSVYSSVHEHKLVMTLNTVVVLTPAQSIGHHICCQSSTLSTCLLLSGFEGRQCEIDISECSSSPCRHGGRCIERSWQALYGSEPLLPAYYDLQHAAGYICSCPPGTTGNSFRITKLN